MSPRTRLIVLLVSTPVLAFTIVGGFLGKAIAREGTYQHLRVFEDVVSLILNNYVEDVELAKVMDGAMRGLSDGLDADSAYLAPADVAALEEEQPLPAGSVGIELTRQYYLRVLSVRDGSPAARAGVRSGDYIRAIGEESTRAMSVFEGTRRLRGDVGTTVSLTVIRGNAADPHVVELERREDTELNVSGRLAAPGVAYVRVPAFAPDTGAQIAAQLEKLKGATQLVLDLRGTAEGALEDGLEAARLFVPSGTLATTDVRGKVVETFTAESGDGEVALPTVILINSGTSQAAELFAAALVDHERATLIGEPTIGRAGEQRLVKLPDGSGLWMTWKRYLRPSGEPIQGTGLEPDVEVEEPEVEFGAPSPDRDPILEAALKQLAEKKAA